MIFKGKKRDPRFPESYRPFSLINTVYKIYASMLDNRLQNAIDDRISPVQFGGPPFPRFSKSGAY